MAIAIGYNPEGGYDLVNDHGLLTDDGLDAAVIVSLFTDARVTDDELRANGLPLEDHRGFWGDTFPEIAGDQMGSKLWLLTRANRTDATLALAKTYAEQSLNWLLEDELAVSVDVVTEWYGGTHLLVVGVQVQRPGPVKPRWRRLWNAISGELLESA